MHRSRRNNADLDEHIATLKRAMAREGTKEAVFDPTRLPQNNRSGRKMMQSYFRQRGVSVKFSRRSRGGGFGLPGRVAGRFDKSGRRRHRPLSKAYWTGSLAPSCGVMKPLWPVKSVLT